MFGRGGQQSAGCRKTCGQGAKRTQILAMGCSTPGLALWRGCLACRVNGGFRAPESSLANHLNRLEQAAWGDDQAERLGGLEIDD